MRLTLCLPGLLLPRQAFLDTVSGLELPALSRLIGRGRLQRDVPAAHYDRLMQRWNLEALPAAALRLLGEGGTPGEADWLCLDPVHLAVDRRGVKLDDPELLDLTAEENAALVAALAPLFEELGALSSAAPGHWYLRLDEPLKLVTLPVMQAAGLHVDAALPSGKDGMRLRHLLAEAQTLLHDHPVNRAREAAGQPVINSVWPWGQGRLAPLLAASPFDTIWSTDPVLRGLAQASDISGGDLPTPFTGAEGNTLAVVDSLAGPARRFDALAWCEALQALERDWFAPALAALRGGRCTALRIAGFGPDASVDVELGRADAFKFWRRPLPLARLVQ